MIYRFDIEPFQCPRPRMNTKTGSVYMPSDYKQDKNILTGLALAQRFKASSRLRLAFGISMPASWSNKKRQEHLHKPHQQKPDLDNLQKSVLDALYPKDESIYEISCTKFWSDKGMILVETMVD